ncbi:MAG: hypothetical protein NVSMB4_06960 [Acidimicrobiales bacterium]
MLRAGTSNRVGAPGCSRRGTSGLRAPPGACRMTTIRELYLTALVMVTAYYAVTSAWDLALRLGWHA